MISVDYELQASDLQPAIQELWSLSAQKIAAIANRYTDDMGTPVFTIEGRYVSQGWTEWTQGFQFGSAILQFDATQDTQFLDIGREATRTHMAPHVTHCGVHDHGFNNVSTYGNLLRLAREGRFTPTPFESDFYELALKASGAVQAMRWSRTYDGEGYIYSFNGPHSLFCDTIRSLRSLAIGHQLGHSLMGENDERIRLIDRLIQHARTTAKYNVYYGEGRDHYDVCGRVAHESIFNTNDGHYRCPSTQQGYSPFTTWTRGLAWIIAGYPEQLEFLETCDDSDFGTAEKRADTMSCMLQAARAAADYYLASSPSDGVPYWDTGAPGLVHLDGYLDRPSDPFNEWEPVDSSAAAIAAQGLLRLGHYLHANGDDEAGKTYWQAGLTVSRSLLTAPYLSTSTQHEGLLLHTIYHRPRGWDHTPNGSRIPHSESCQWGDYHLRELGLYLQRVIEEDSYYAFYLPATSAPTRSR